MKALFLKLHRWLALAFSLPLAVVIVTGLILSFEPLVVANAVQPGSVKADAVVAALQAHDPQGRARMLSLDHASGTLTISARGGRKSVDLATGQPHTVSGGARGFLLTSRRLHETLLVDAKWLVDLSTIAMLVFIGLGVLMGLPRIRNTIAGWHKGIAWGLLPLLILSPLTGIAVAFGITLSSPSPTPGPPPADMAAAVRILAKDHDLSRMIWLRKFGPRVNARLLEDGEYRVYAVTRNGAVAQPRNWPRLLHEGNWFGAAPALVNAVIALAMTALLGTGLYAWGRRKWRVRRRA